MSHAVRNCRFWISLCLYSSSTTIWATVTNHPPSPLANLRTSDPWCTKLTFTTTSSFPHRPARVKRKLKRKRYKYIKQSDESHESYWWYTWITKCHLQLSWRWVNRKFNQSTSYNHILEVRYLSGQLQKMMNTLSTLRERMRHGVKHILTLHHVKGYWWY